MPLSVLSNLNYTMTDKKIGDIIGIEADKDAVASVEVAVAENAGTEVKEGQMDLRFKVALNEVLGRYPQLAEDIKKSLLTPQIGEHHQEGPKMDSHLKLILENLRKIALNEFPVELEVIPGIKDILREVVMAGSIASEHDVVLNPALVDYAFLHDLEKSNSLSLKFEGRKDQVEITWEQWVEIESRGEPYKYVDKEGKEILILGVSYLHRSKGKEGAHGFKAAKKIAEVAPEVPKTIGSAINKHEVAYQFTKVSATVYEDHFVKTGFTDEEQRFILAASYIDTMSSLKKDADGISLKPDLGNYIRLVRSRNNYLLIKKALDNGLKFRENEIGNKKNADRDLTYAELEEIALKDMVNKTLDMASFEQNLAALVVAGTISEDDKGLVLQSIAKSEAEFNALGKSLRAKFKPVKEAYSKALK